MTSGRKKKSKRLFIIEFWRDSQKVNWYFLRFDGGHASENILLRTAKQGSVFESNFNHQISEIFDKRFNKFLSKGR